jgi:hypothetical protein
MDTSPAGVLPCGTSVATAVAPVAIDNDSRTISTEVRQGPMRIA